MQCRPPSSALAQWSGVPVYNGLTDEFHPTQVLADLRAKVGADGYANLKTLSGDALSVRFRGDTAMIYSESKNIGRITIGDVDQSNGVIHVVDTVMVPK